MVTIGNYEVVRQIGEGGFARTYEGQHLRNHNIKACLKQTINLSPADASLLEREAELLAQIHYQSLPAFRDLVKAPDNSLVLIMSFIAGKTLDYSVKKHKALHPEDVCWISQRMLNSLYYLHTHGIIHGDVKPPNIIVQPSEHNAFLVDYGLSSIRPKASSKAMGYTAVFAAPELLEGKPPLPESDLYSLGITMAYALGGDPITKQIPEYVPAPLQEFVKNLMRPNVLERPNWDKQDLVARLSDIRQEVFKRRHSGEK